MMLLRDVKDHPKRKVNLIGIVVEFSIPRMSEGTALLDLGVALGQNLSHVIGTCCMGLIEGHKQDVYAVFNKSFSSFALFDGKCSSVFSPLILVKSHDIVNVVKLENWFQIVCQRTFLSISPYAVSLNEIKEREFVDLVCKEPNGEAVAVWSCAHVSNFITVLTLTDYESTKFSTLMDLLTFSKVTCATLEDRTARIYMLYCVVKMR
ncbi:hypothetical protein RHMOL_Rhmol02G0000300 [Rhododendron molle]|uniref:Uncharacterized protein n=1 Tax=Rhododendron molle TaxID=49168 RepID=A0ACC0PK82_RHOML|nr:hypothetical protein RHMOL_Rhmol02G0000300 [Rhododendron molle]